jgi:hypothetical protein
MNNLYYSERQEGEAERERQDISGSFWGGFVSFIESRSRDGWFAERYPIHCFEAPLPIETDYDSLGQAFSAHNPGVPWPLNSLKAPPTLHVLDAVEFFGSIVTMPTQRVYHDYGRHHHITNFDRTKGFDEYRSEVNTMLRRCGHPFEINSSGQVQRLGPPILRESLASAVFSSGDLDLDRLLETARRKFQDPDLIIRTEALEKLWDAWERLKTILPGDKKTSVKALLDAAVAEPTLRDRVEGEARELTDIGNNFMIRHTETDKVPIKESEHVDYLFHRMFALILMILRAWRKKGV